MANIAAIEKAVMTTADEKMLKQMAESMPFDIYQQLSPEARGRLSKVYGTEVPASSPYTGELPLKKHTQSEKNGLIEAIRNRQPIIEYPYGNPDELLERIAQITKSWADDKKSSEGAMSGIHTILAQNRRI